MLSDAGSRDPAFLAVVARVRAALVALAGGSPGAHSTVIVPGSGTAAVEGMLGSLVPRAGGRLLVAANGAYGRRMAAMAAALGIEHSLLDGDERAPLDTAGAAAAAAAAEAAGRPFSHVAAVHHETTAGVESDMLALGAALGRLARPPELLVDSMSGFGALPVDVVAWRAAAVVSSANKCIEGVPGFSFVVARRDALARARGNARSLYLDLAAQADGLDATGQFRFTPPTHALLAFDAALAAHAAEGGPRARLARYAANERALLDAVRPLGLRPWVGAGRAPIITTFAVPDDAAFRFGALYDALAAAGYVIYPGKTTSGADTFRVGCIGQIFPSDLRALAGALERELRAQGVKLPVRQREFSDV